MVDSVSNNLSGAMSSTLSAASKPQAAADKQSASPVQFSIDDGAQSVSPRMVSDPMSGVLIVEYLSSDGAVRMQVPSEVTVAYLRSGLTAAGYPKADVQATKDAQAPQTVAEAKQSGVIIA